MSDITISRPELVNGHTDVICSTSIRHILAVRKSTLLQIDTLIRQLAEISAMTESIGGKTALDILIAWLQDNIDCESGIIFDNNEDKTDSAALLPCIEQAREDIRTLRQLQLQHQNR